MIQKAIKNMLPTIEKLDVAQQRKLLFAICQRQEGIYKNFAQKSRLPSQAYEEIFLLLGKTIFSEEITKKITEFAPDMDDFAGNLAASMALDACAILNQTFMFFDKAKIEYLANILELCLNVPEMYAQESQNESFFAEELTILKQWIEDCEKNEVLKSMPLPKMELLYA